MILDQFFPTDANSTTSKTPLDAISSKSGDFNKVAEKKSLVKAFSPIWPILKFSQEEIIVYHCSGEKHNGEIAEPVWPTVLEIGTRSVQEGGTEPSEMVPA